MKSKITDWHPAVHDLITYDIRCIGCDKKLYKTIEYAEYARDTHPDDWEPVRIYPCKYDLGYHLTSMPPSDRYPERTGIKHTHKKRGTRNRKKLREKLGSLNEKRNTSQEVVTES